MSDCAADTSLRISELFVSLQGEGLASGRTCFFIRLAGCNLRCRWCDTAYAWHDGRYLGLDELMERWCISGIPLVHITGGEPLMQPAVISLMQSLLSAGAEVLLETNGSLDIACVPANVTKIVDRKTPSSGMNGRWLDGNLKWMGAGDQLKFVIGSRGDYRWACGEMNRMNLHSDVTVLFSPVAGYIKPSELADWIVSDRLDVRFQVQLHRILWGERRGV